MGGWKDWLKGRGWEERERRKKRCCKKITEAYAHRKHIDCEMKSASFAPRPTEPSEARGPRRYVALWISKPRCGPSLTFYFAAYIRSRSSVKRHPAAWAQTRVRTRLRRAKCFLSTQQGKRARANVVNTVLHRQRWHHEIINIPFFFCRLCQITKTSKCWSFSQFSCSALFLFANERKQRVTH